MSVDPEHILAVAKRIAKRDRVDDATALRRAQAWARRKDRAEAAQAVSGVPPCLCPSPRCQHPDCRAHFQRQRERRAGAYYGSSGNW